MIEMLAVKIAARSTPPLFSLRQRMESGRIHGRIAFDCLTRLQKTESSAKRRMNCANEQRINIA